MTYVHFAVKACLSNGTFPHFEPAHRVSSLLSLGIHASVQYVRVEAEPCAQGSDKEGVGYQESELSEEDPRRHDQNKGQPCVQEAPSPTVASFEKYQCRLRLGGGYRSAYMDAVTGSNL